MYNYRHFFARKPHESHWVIWHHRRNWQKTARQDLEEVISQLKRLCGVVNVLLYCIIGLYCIILYYCIFLPQLLSAWKKLLLDTFLYEDFSLQPLWCLYLRKLFSRISTRDSVIIFSIYKHLLLTTFLWTLLLPTFPTAIGCLPREIVMSKPLRKECAQIWIRGGMSRNSPGRSALTNVHPHVALWTRKFIF